LRLGECQGLLQITHNAHDLDFIGLGVGTRGEGRTLGHDFDRSPDCALNVQHEMCCLRGIIANDDDGLVDGAGVIGRIKSHGDASAFARLDLVIPLAGGGATAGRPHFFDLEHLVTGVGKGEDVVDHLAAGPMIDHVFAFTNTGDEVLEIKEVRPSCGCTTTGEWDHEVQPGKGGSIPVRFNSANYTGPIHKTVIVVCNDPSQTTHFVLHIQGTIWRPIEIMPESATFATSSDTQTNEVKVVRI